MSYKMEELKKMLFRELDELVDKGELSMGDLDTAHKLTDTIKNICKICSLEEDGGYSGNGDWEARGSYGHYPQYGDNSYSRRRRDSMGRHSRDGDYRHSRDGKEHAANRLREMMKAASADEREALQIALDGMNK